MIQHGITIGSIKNLDTGSYFAINLVNFLALKLIQHGITMGSIKNLHTVDKLNLITLATDVVLKYPKHESFFAVPE